MTRAHARLLGPCFKTGRVEGRQKRHRPEVPRSRAQPPIRNTRSSRTARSTSRLVANRTDGGSSLRAGTVDPRRPDRSQFRQLQRSTPGKNASNCRIIRPPGRRSWRLARGKCTRRRPLAPKSVPGIRAFGATDLATG